MRIQLNSFKMGNKKVIFSSCTPVLIALIVMLSPCCEAFFFPKSFFRSEEPTQPPPVSIQQQQHPRILGNRFPFGSIETLQGSGTDIQPALRIVNRPPPPRYNQNNEQNPEQGPPPGSGFHVPRDLCLACEKFPWMPVAGERPTPSGSSTSTGAASSQSQQTLTASYNSPQQPTKTIVINALGEAPGPIPFPPAGIPNRRPFAIQFDGGQSSNNVNQQQQQGRRPHQQQEISHQQVQLQPSGPPAGDSSKRPVSFQIFQAESNEVKPPTVLHQVSQTLGVSDSSGPSQEYGQPTILQPQNLPANKLPIGEKQPQGYVQQQQQLFPHPNNNAPPPPPHTVGTIVASQQGNSVVGKLPEFQQVQPAKLVYHEHFISPTGPPSSQNFKIPIITQGGEDIPNMKPPPPPPIRNPPSSLSGNGYVQNQGGNNVLGGGPPPPPQGNLFLQMRPPAPFNVPFPRPSTNMKPPGPMIHYGKPVHIPNNIGPQRPSGQVLFPPHPPPPQGFIQMGPPPPPPPQQQQQSNPPPQYGINNDLQGNDIRRPAPSGTVLNVLPNNNLQQQFQPQVNPLPIPVPTSVNRPFPQQNNNNIIRPDAQSPPVFTQEAAGWEIIPSIQTDLTHLFEHSVTGGQNLQGGEGLRGRPQLPVPVPIPVPQQSQNAPKSPFFIVDGQVSHQQQPSQNLQHQAEQNEQIKVQDVTYHEEAKPGNNEAKPLVEASTNALNENVQPQPQKEAENYRLNSNPSQFIRPRPFILGVPSARPPPPMRPVVFAQQHPSQYSQFQPPLPPSIMTDMKHSQQTSLLTHQYLSQVNGGQPIPIRENGIFVRPVVTAIINSQLHPHLQQQQQQHLQQQQTDNNLIQEVGAGTSQVNQGVDPRIPGGVAPQSQEYVAHNCQNIQQVLGQTAASPPPNQLRQEPVKTEDNPDQEENNVEHNEGEEASQSFNSEQSQPASQAPGVRGSVNVQDNGNKGSYVLYYPRPVSKSPVYWVQQPTTGQGNPGVIQLTPQMPSLAPSTVGSMVSWSRPRVVVANQFRTHYKPQGQDQQSNYKDEEKPQESFKQEHEINQGRLEPIQESVEQTSDENIPFGQKLGVNRDKTRTPFDIISVSGSDEIQQSLENSNNEDEQVSHTPQQSTKEQEEVDYNLSGPGNDDATSKYVGEYAGEVVTGQQDNAQSQTLENVEEQEERVNNLQTNNFENDDSDDEREDFSLRPPTTNNFLRPVSTTVIHSPGASSFQSIKLSSFRPNKVIVHDFTSHSSNAAATGPLQPLSSSAPSTKIETELSPTRASPSSIWEQQGGRIKAPKYVENDEEEDQDSSAESINRPQGLNIHEVIASGPVQTADCVTTGSHTGHGHSFASSSSTLSPRAQAADIHGISSKGREIYFPLGSRFPGGRPSIFSAINRPSPPILTSSKSTTITPSEVDHEDDPIITTTTTTHNSFGVPAPSSSSSGFAASIPVPVYRRPISNSFQDDNTDGDGSLISHGVTYIKPQTSNVLIAEDIYKESEGKAEAAIRPFSPSRFIPETTTFSTTTSEAAAETVDPSDVVMSTEKSSSFSVSIGENHRRKQPEEERRTRMKVVQVTSVPVVTTEQDPTTTPEGANSSTTTVPSAASTSTKIVKTVRVRQRMRSGSFANGPIRNRFHGQGRVRVVHRPATQEYIRHFPEFSTQDGADKLAKEEEQEVKNALIELKKSPESVKTH